MTASTSSGGASLSTWGGAQPDADKAELCVFLQCGDFVGALPAQWIDRLVLPIQTQTLIVPAEADAEELSPGLLEVAGQRYASWQLGALLELDIPQIAWVLLRVPHLGSEVPMAVGTGECLFVAPLGATIPLPPGVFRIRPQALSHGFPSSQLGDRAGPGTQSAVGLVLDPSRLWTTSELSASAAILSGARQKGKER
ncbi:MAG: hypothetical protein IPG50_21015 [Myxococcales bacterium]|nr:hypothetical protein [Myxococcales bacterium]